MTVTVAPVQWADLKNIDEVEPLNDSDHDCLTEVRDVLKRHGKLDRFGVALLHSHFDLQPDEIMLEAVNEADRTLVTSIVKQTSEPANHIGTIWSLRDDATTMAYCKQYCKRPEYWQMSHTPKHDRRK